MSDFFKQLKELRKDVRQVRGILNDASGVERSVISVVKNGAGAVSAVGNADNMKNTQDAKYDKKRIDSETGLNKSKTRYLHSDDKLNAELNDRAEAFGADGSGSANLSPSEKIELQNRWKHREELVNQLKAEEAKDNPDIKTLKKLEKKIDTDNELLNVPQGNYGSSDKIAEQTKRANEQSANTKELVDAVIAVNSANSATDRANRVSALIGVIDKLEEEKAELGPIRFVKNGNHVTLTARDLSGDLDKVAVHISEELSDAGVGQRRAKPLSIDDIERAEGKIELAKTANIRSFETLMKKAGLDVTQDGIISDAEREVIATFATAKEIDLSVKAKVVTKSSGIDDGRAVNVPDLHIDNPNDAVTQQLRTALAAEAKALADKKQLEDDKRTAEDKDKDKDNKSTTNTEVTNPTTKPKTEEKWDYVVPEKLKGQSSQATADVQIILERIGFATDAGGTNDHKVDGVEGKVTKASVLKVEEALVAAGKLDKSHAVDGKIDAELSEVLKKADPKLLAQLQQISGGKEVSEVFAQNGGSQTNSQGTGRH